MMGFSVSPYVALFAVFALWSGHLQAYCVAIACILLHELGHALTCDLLGFALREIRIHAFGASLQTDELLEENPRAEALVAAAGPAASLLLGGVSYILFCQLRWEIFYLFFVYHMIFGVFNLLPAFPMDGGRILHACLMQKAGMRKAQKICCAVGICVGICLILWSLAAWRLFGVNAPLFCIGVVLILSALRQKRCVSSYVLGSFQKQQALQMGEVLPVQVLAVSFDTPLWKVLQFLRQANYSRIEVYNNQMQLVGHVQEQTIALAAAQMGKNTLVKQLCKPRLH